MFHVAGVPLQPKPAWPQGGIQATNTDKHRYLGAIHSISFLHQAPDLRLHTFVSGSPLSKRSLDEPNGHCDQTLEIAVFSDLQSTSRRPMIWLISLAESALKDGEKQQWFSRNDIWRCVTWNNLNAYYGIISYDSITHVPLNCHDFKAKAKSTKVTSAWPNNLSKPQGGLESMKDNVHSNWQKYDKSISLTNFLQNYSNITQIVSDLGVIRGFALHCFLLSWLCLASRRQETWSASALRMHRELELLQRCRSSIKRQTDLQPEIHKWQVYYRHYRTALRYSLLLFWGDLLLMCFWVGQVEDWCSFRTQADAGLAARCKNRELNTRWNIGEIESVGACWWDCCEEQWRNMQVCNDVKRSCCSNSQLDLCRFRWMFQVLRTYSSMALNFQWSTDLFEHRDFLNDRNVTYSRELLFKLRRLSLRWSAYAECTQFRFQFGRWPCTAQKPLQTPDVSVTIPAQTPSPLRLRMTRPLCRRVASVW